MKNATPPPFPPPNFTPSAFGAVAVACVGVFAVFEMASYVARGAGRSVVEEARRGGDDAGD